MAISDDSVFEDQHFTKLARSYESDAWWPELQAIKSFSMLHFETLYLLRHFASQADGAVVEVGAYRGGSTIALGRGVQAGSKGPVITFEVGGAYPTHPDLPTDDILGDLRTHIKQFGVENVVTIIDSYTTDPSREEDFKRLLDGKKIDVVFIDADGHVDRDFDHLRRWLGDGAIIIVDDYMTHDASEKSTLVSEWVDNAIASGLCEDLGLYRWGTWFGRYQAQAP